LWTYPEDLTAIGFWNHAKAILTQLFADKRADCIAHPFMWKTIREHITDGGNEDGTYVTRIIPDNELGDLLELGFRSSVAWELNKNAIKRDPVFYKRMFNLGKEIGVVFNYGTDAHTLAPVNTKEEIETIKSILY
jgi:histidinol phosphatase-like PHP family hydrolase